MVRTIIHFIGLVSLSSVAAEPRDVQIVDRQELKLRVAIDDAGSRIDAIQLWYTDDEGKNWHQANVDWAGGDAVTFRAPHEGLFGFFMVAVSKAGASGTPPDASTQAHAWAFVDYSAPIVQLHSLRATTHLGRQVVEIRWSAVEDHPADRPIDILYRRAGQKEWIPISNEPFAGTGRFDWRPPAELTGSIEVRVSARDRVGHVTDTDSQMVLLMDRPSEGSQSPHGDRLNPTTHGLTTVSNEARDRAGQVFRRGLEHGSRGEWLQGIARMREAVKIDPAMTDAFAEMAGMLYRIGDDDSALEAYEIALRQAPLHRDALRGSAMVLQRRKEYASAATRLLTVLDHDSRDAETWLSLGDVAVFQGDELLAREAYQHALTADALAEGVIEDARKRMALMNEVSRSYR